MAQLVDFVVYCCDFFYVSIRGAYICLRLIIVVIAYKELNCAVREELPKLRAKLRCKRFVVRKHERGLLHTLYYLCHCKCFSAPGYA